MKTSEMILQAMSEIASRQFAEAYNTLSAAYDEAKKSEFRTLALHGIRDDTDMNKRALLQGIGVIGGKKSC